MTPTNKALKAARTADELVADLRHAHEHSQQRIVGSDIFKQAADMIERLAEENARLSKLAVDAVRPMVGAAKSAVAERDALKRQLEKAEQRCVEVSQSRADYHDAWCDASKALTEERRRAEMLLKACYVHEPRCRDCADHNGRCQDTGPPCDPYERAVENIAKWRDAEQRIAAMREGLEPLWAALHSAHYQHDFTYTQLIEAVERAQAASRAAAEREAGALSSEEGAAG